MSTQPDNDKPAPKKRGPKKGTVKRPDVSQANREKPNDPRFAQNPDNERTVLISGRVSQPVADRLAAEGRGLNNGERIERLVRRVIDSENGVNEW